MGNNVLKTINEQEKLFELSTKPVIEVGKIEELGKQIQEFLEQRKNIVVTEDNLKESDEYRLEAQKLYKAIEEQRLEVRRSVLEPYEESLVVYEPKIKEPLKDFIDHLKSQTDELYEKIRQERENKFVEVFNEQAEALNIDFVTFKDLDLRINRTTPTDKIILDEISRFFERIENDLNLIETEEDIDLKVRILSRYKTSLDLTTSVTSAKQEKKQVEEALARKEALAKQVEEKRAATPKEERVIEEPKEEDTVYQTTFTVFGSKDKIKLLKDFLIENDFKFKGEN